MIIYAEASDLIGGSSPWLASEPANASTLLRYASILVALACNRDLYTDTPTSDEAPVLKDATCAQVASWVALGVDPAKAGTDFPAPVKSSTILDGKVDRDTSRQIQAIADAANGLCDLSRAILLSAGLLWQAVATGDAAPYLLDYGLGCDPASLDPFSWGCDLTAWPCY